MKNGFSSWSLGGKLIGISSCLAIISLFMDWVDLGIFSASGFEQQGYLFLILFIYPVYVLLKGIRMNKIIGLICSIIAIIGSIAFVNSKSVDILGQTIQAAGVGLYLFVIASILLTIGIMTYTNGVNAGSQNQSSGVM